MVRRATGGSLVQDLVLIAIITILATRAYLAATGYPQIGGGTLHIAHALWGGALMVAALIVSFTFIGRRARRIAVLTGGIGFGLFLDEVGKFITKSNDYFFAPSVAIMYVVVVIVLLANRALQDTRHQTPDDALIEAAAATTESLAGGITDRERAVIAERLRVARDGGADPAAAAGVAAALAACPALPPSAAERLHNRLSRRDSAAGARLTLFAAITLTLFCAAGLVSAAITLTADLHDGGGAAIVSVGRLAGSLVATLLCVAALGTAAAGRGGLWPLRLLRGAALVTILLTNVFDFVAQQFGALINVGVGLTALAVFGFRLQFLARPAAGEPAAPPL